MNGYIYKITNDINGKMYIGLCTSTIQERFQRHCQDRKKDSHKERPLYRAMNKYGTEHFHIEVIEECPMDNLGEREQYWISYYNTYAEGYNATLGGEGKPLYDHQKIYEKLLKCPYPCLVAKEFGCSVDIVRKIAKVNNIQLKNIGAETMKNRTQKAVLAFDKKTNEFVKEFESTASAAQWCFENGYSSTLTSGVRSHIAEVANGKRKTAFGFVWRYKI